MFDINKINYELRIQKEVTEILKCNDVSCRYGIILKESDAKELIIVRQETIKDVGLIEFKSTIVEEIVLAFCDSQFITKYDYLDVLSQLVEIFYYYRKELDELISDEDIIKYMQLAFEGPCQGSLEQLSDYQLDKLLDDISANRDIFEELAYAYD
ncbi:DUF6323 family protein [Thomasclavelia sp.]